MSVINEMRQLLGKSRLLRILLQICGVYLFCVLLHPLFFDADGVALIAMQVYGVAFAAAFIYICVLIPYAGVGIYMVVSFIACVLAYAFHAFGYQLSDELIYAAFQTNAEETGAFISSFFLFYVTGKLTLLAALFYFMRYLSGASRKIGVIRRLLCLSVASVAFLAIYLLPSMVFFRIKWEDPTINERIVRNFSPNNYRWHPFFSLPEQRPPFETFMENYRLPFSDLKKLVQGIREYYTDLELHNVAADNSVATLDDELICILVIGESVRADRFGLNGYARNTTPRLAQIPGLCNFSNMFSYGGSTEFSFRSIFTGLTMEEERVSRTSFVSILAKHGFRCCYYAENADDMTKMRLGDETIGKFLDERCTLKGSIKEVAETVLERISVSPAKHQFIILQNGTGHYPYSHDSAYTVFTPSQQADRADDDDRTGLLNDYDNCIVAADALMAELIEGVKGRNAVLLYVSDHGELLGEDGKWNHGDSTNPYLRHVPAFVWFSDEYCSRHAGEVAEFLRIKDKPLVHGQIFKTVLRLCSVRTEAETNMDDFIRADVRQHPNNLPDSILRKIDAL